MMGLTSFPSLFAEDRIFLKGSASPTVGTVLGCDEKGVNFELSKRAKTVIQRATIQRVEIPVPGDLEKGLKLWEDGKWKDAIKALEPSHLRYQGLPQDWIEVGSVRLGQSYLAEGSWAKAGGLFSSFQKFYPTSEFRDVALSGQAEAAFHQDQTDVAMNLLEKLIADHSKEISVSDEQSRALGRAHLILGRCYLAAKKTDEALRSFLATTTLYYRDPKAVMEAKYESALLFEKMNDFGQAQTQYEEYIDEFPDAPQIAQAKQRLENLKSAVKSD
jgi:tetratricopeptide (TPR) repeat protein